MKNCAAPLKLNFIIKVILIFIFLISLAAWQVDGAMAQAGSLPAQMNKSFSPISIPAGGISTLSVTIYNPNSFALTLSSTPPAWTDTLPAGLNFASPSNAATTCGGTVTNIGNQLSLIGGTVPAQAGITPGSCSVTVSVTSTTAGNLVNTIPATTLQAADPTGTIQVTNTTPASATLQVIAIQKPSLSKSFNGNTVWTGQISVLSIIIKNNDASSALTQVSLSDSLPNNVIVGSPALPAGWNTNCGGSAAVTGSGGLPLANGDSIVNLNNISIAANLTCTIKVNVVSTTPGVYTNIIPANAIHTQQGVTNSSAAQAPLNVQADGITKTFSPVAFLTGGASTLTITLKNPTASPYTGAAITDNLPAGLTVASAPASPQCSGSITSTATSISLSGGIIPAGSIATPGTCTIVATVTSNTPATYTNTIPVGALTTDQLVTNVITAPANLTVYGTGLGLTGSKTFSAASIAVGGTSTLTINIAAPADIALTTVSLTDALPSGVQVASPPSPTTIANCGAGIFAPSAGDTLLSFSGGAIPKGQTCTLTVKVTSNTPGIYTNTISPANISDDQNRNVSGNFSAILTVGGLSISKAFYPTTVSPNGLSTLTITLTNTNTSQLDSVSLISDSLPGTLINGVVIANPPNATTTCAGGSITAAAGTQLLQMSSGTVPAQVAGVAGICTINVNVIGKGSAAPYTNTIAIGKVSGTIHGTSTVVSNGTAASAILTVGSVTIGVVKGFNPLTVFGGSTSVLTVQLTNPNNVPLAGISLTDNLPQGTGGGMTVANPPNLSVGTCGGALSAAPGATSFSFGGGVLAANTNCMLTLNVTMNVNANLTNNIPIGAVTTSNGASNSQAASATLTNLPGATVSKAFSPNPTLAGAGNSSTLTITIQNTANFSLSGMGLIDNLPAGVLLTDTPAPVNNCGGSLDAPAGSGHIQLSGGSMGGILNLGDPAVTCTIVVNVTAPAAGNYQNCIAVNALTNNENAKNTTAACDTLTVIAPPTISKAFAPATIPAGSSSVLTFTLRNPATNTVPLTGVGFSDTFPAGLTAASVPNSPQCNGGSVTSTSNSITLTGSSIPINSTCTVIISVTAAAGGSYLNTSDAVTSTNGGAGNTASATLLVISPPAISKSFTPNSITAGATSALEFDITNPNAGTTLTGVGFTDAFPTGILVADLPNASTSGCNASSSPVFAPTAGSSSLLFSTGSIVAGGTCIVKVDVKAAGGTFVNTTSSVTSTNGGIGNTGSDTLSVTGGGLSLLKTTSTTGYQTAGDTIAYSYTLTNSGTTTLYPPFNVSDDHIGSPLGTPFTCNDNALASLAPLGIATCSANYTVQAADVTAKSVTNTATATAQDAETGGSTVSSNPSSVKVNLVSLILKKTSITAGYKSIGNTISYSYTLTNKSNVTLTGADVSGEFTITDDHIGSPLGTAFTCGTVTSLPPQANVTCPSTYTVAAADITAGAVTNTATGHALNGVTPVNSNQSSATVNLVAAPSISKSFSPNPIPVATNSTLTFTITNPPANTVPLTGVAFTDNFPAGLTVAIAPDGSQCGGVVTNTNNQISLSAGTILPNSTCTVTVKVTAGASGSYLNTTNVSSTNGGNGLTATDTLAVVSPPTISKAFSPTSILVNGTSTITFTIINPNASAALSGVGFTDAFPAGLQVANLPNVNTSGCSAASTPVFAPAAADTSLTFSNGSIAVGGTCRVNVDVTGTTSGVKNNTTGTITSTEGGAGSTSNTATLGVNAPSLTLAKSITSGSPYNTLGGQIHYSYLLTNNGNVTLIGNGTGGLFTVTDDRATVVCPSTPTGLAPGNTVTCTAIYTLTQADLDSASVTNHATAHGLFGALPVNSNQDQQTATGTQSPALTLAKSITSGSPYSKVGDTVAYSYLLTNTGNVTLAGNDASGMFTITDDHIGSPSCTAFTCGAATSLAPSATITCSASYTITQPDLDSGSVTNLANGHALFGPTRIDSNPSTQTANATQTPDLTLKKSITSGDPFNAVGGKIDYSYLLTNSGNVTLTGDNSGGVFTVSDDKTTVTCPASPISLAPTDTITCTATYTLLQADLDRGSVTNLATGHAFFGSKKVDSNPDTLTATGNQTSGLSLAKGITAGNPFNAVGGKIDYSYLLTNIGNVTLKGKGSGGSFTVSDDRVTVTCPSTPASLASGDTITCTASYTLTQADLDSGSVTNIATGHALWGATPVDSNQDTQTASGVQKAELTLAKSITSGSPYSKLGDKVAYSYLLTNSGNVTLKGIGAGGIFTVSDDKATVTCPSTPISLASGDTITCSAAYTIVQSDLDNGSLTNQATAHAAWGAAPVDSNLDTRTANATQTPGLVLKKSITAGNPYAALGDIVTYSYLLTNNGNLTLTGSDPSGLFTITDDHIGSPLGTAFTCGTVTSLAPGATITCTANYSITQADLDSQSVTNTATGHAMFGTAPVDSNQDTATANIKRGAITGIVFNDANLNLVQDKGELGIKGVTVTIYDSTGTTIVATVTTGADGSYSVSNLLPGTYLVEETDLTGSLSTTPNLVSVLVPPGETAQANFGDYKIPGSTSNRIQGVVFDDANTNGALDKGELVIPGVTITLLDQDGKVVATTITGPKGSYSFTKLPAGIYTVVETNPDGYTSTTLDHVSVALSSGTTAVVNYGDQQNSITTIDPAVTKYGDLSSAKIGDTVAYVISVGNNGSADALNVVLTDTKPDFLDIINIEISPDKSFPVTISGNTFTINFGTVTPTDFYTVTVVTKVNKLAKAPGGVNQVSIKTDSANDPIYNDNSDVKLIIKSNNPPSGGSGPEITGTLPLTGFAPGKITSIPAQPQNIYNADTGMTIEIPALGIKTTIVGIPQTNGSWDVTWLGSQLGYLDGTAFPTWSGNSVITGHVYDANGKPGPFVNLGNLKWGDQIIIHDFGQSYVYEVRLVYITNPENTSVFAHEDLPWLTLVTCKQYDASTGTYKLRTIVKAVLVNVTSLTK